MRQRLRHTLLKINLQKAPAMPCEVRARLIDEYREDILALQNLIARDLSNWLN
jgi:hypothetical protein